MDEQALMMPMSIGKIFLDLSSCSTDPLMKPQSMTRNWPKKYVNCTLAKKKSPKTP